MVNLILPFLTLPESWHLSAERWTNSLESNRRPLIFQDSDPGYLDGDDLQQAVNERNKYFLVLTNRSSDFFLSWQVQVFHASILTSAYDFDNGKVQ